MSRGQSPPSISQTSSFSIDQASNPYITPYAQHYSQHYPPAGPSTTVQAISSYQPNFRSVTVNDGQSTVSAQVQKRYTAEENEIMNQTLERCSERLRTEHRQILDTTVETPFIDVADVVKRLLPYHVFQQPRDDLVNLMKGKEKAQDTGSGWDTDEIFGKLIGKTKFAIECFKRMEALKTKYRSILTRSAKRASSDGQSYFLAQMLLDQDRAESALLSSDLRASRAELEKVEREKRAAVTTYYRPYPYSYAQTYTGTIQPVSQPVQVVAPATAATPTFAPTPVPFPTAAIPVQLPVSSLPALHALGIVPVPAVSLPQGGQTQAAAVLRGSTANGTMLSLEINVSLLNSSQMSGLALVLNSLVNRSTSGGSTTSSPPNMNGTSSENNST